jgi:hypothetical protein
MKVFPQMRTGEEEVLKHLYTHNYNFYINLQQAKTERFNSIVPAGFSPYRGTSLDCRPGNNFARHIS